MPPKKEPRNTALEKAIPTLKTNIKRKTGKNVNNSILQTSISAFKGIPSVNLGKASKILSQLYNTEYAKKHAEEEAARIELEKNGGIDLIATFTAYQKKWAKMEDGIKDRPYGTDRDIRTGRLRSILTPYHEKLVADINKYLPKVGDKFNPGEFPVTNTSYYYAERAIASEIMRGDYDDKLEQLKYVVERDGPKIIASDNGKNLLAMITRRKEELAASPPGGGGAGSEGGARRRRRTHKRKATRRRKTHRRH